MDFNSSSPYPEGVISFLDTDLYKLTMQCAVWRYFKDKNVKYKFTNRTPNKKMSRKAFAWLQEQITKLGNISLSAEEHGFLKTHCPYLASAYLDFLREFRLRPRDQIEMRFEPASDKTAGAEESDSDLGDVAMVISGSWVDTMLYEIPILALTSEAYFKYMDTAWDYTDQEEAAFQKGKRLLEAGCVFSEFGTRRRRDYHTQALVFRGLVAASKEAAAKGAAGQLSGTSNVHLAMRFGIPPVGTVAHEWFMGIAAIRGGYQDATEEALGRWLDAFGDSLGITLTDTFGTPAFLDAFGRPVRPLDDDQEGRLRAWAAGGKTYAHIFAGVRQDSGDPKAFVARMRAFYDKQGIAARSKTIVFSDSLDIDRCIECKRAADEAGFAAAFGIGTFFTNDFSRWDGSRSTPLNIVIKLSEAQGRPAIKISDNAGKNTGDRQEIMRAKNELDYVESDWAGGDETRRWGREKQL